LIENYHFNGKVNEIGIQKAGSAFCIRIKLCKKGSVSNKKNKMDDGNLLELKILLAFGRKKILF
jgi:hypothetical protein